MQLLAEIGGINILVGDEVSGTVKAELKENSQSFPITISSFGQDNLGELYVVDYMGVIYKFISN